MEALSVREYRNNLAASFTKADNGEQVLIRRKNEIYALVKVWGNTCSNPFIYGRLRRSDRAYYRRCL
ncbi:hypothetical protein GA257_27265 [Bacteroides xylanisolvens]|nr:hypothetical protein GA257_27265 [Bacteroides xylanisolvens]